MRIVVTVLVTLFSLGAGAKEMPSKGINKENAYNLSAFKKLFFGDKNYMNKADVTLRGTTDDGQACVVAYGSHSIYGMFFHIEVNGRMTTAYWISISGKTTQQFKVTFERSKIESSSSLAYIDERSNDLSKQTLSINYEQVDGVAKIRRISMYNNTETGWNKDNTPIYDEAKARQANCNLN